MKITSEKKNTMLINFVTALFMMSMSLILMSFCGTENESNRVLTIVTGIFFWCGFIGTITAFIFMNITRRKNDKSASEKNGILNIGLFRFFSNTCAGVFDVIMILSLCAFIVVLVVADNISVQLIIMAIFVFSFGMHCILNGINYKYIISKDRRVKK